MKIGIVGLGYVGSAVAASYNDADICINDPLHPDKSVSIDHMKTTCDAIFICVPTPQSDTGACDTTILEFVITNLAGYTGVVISKSTASPLVYQQLEANSGLKLAHVPEFLTQANAINDYLNPKKIVIGCKKSIVDEVTNIVLNSKIEFSGTVEYCSISEASFFKYMANTFLAMKVIMNNEYYDLVQKMNLDWNVLKDIAKTDARLGDSHWNVPGPDGSRGFGGACFPKDTAALLNLSNQFKIDMDMLDTSLIKNKKYRRITAI
jgi:UDPglucose 6-dehydrogenase